MNAFENEKNKGQDVLPRSVPGADQIAQWSISARPGLRRAEYIDIHRVLWDEHTMWDSQVIDEVPTFILPAIKAIPSPTLESQRAGSGVENHLAPVYKLIKTSGIYALASMAPPLVSLLLAPLLTHRLSATNYGILTILNTFISLGVGITQLGLSSAFFRTYGYDYILERDRRDVLATVTALLCLISIPAALGVAILSPYLANLIFGQPSLGSLVTLAGLVILMQNLTVPGFALLRAESRAIFYSLLMVSNVLITLIATFVLVGVLHLGVTGSLIATGAGYAGAMLYMIPMTLLRAGIKIRADIARALLAFGIPLALNFISYWVLQVSDRYLLSLFGSLAQVASYAVAYSLGSVMSVVVLGPFTLAWPTAMFSIAKREDSAQVFRLLFRWFSLFLLFSAFGLSFVGTALLDWLFPVTYQSAAPIIPVIAESIAFFGVYYIFMVGANVLRKTWLAAVFTTTAALVNLVINLALIPLLGAMGAAISTLLAFIVLALLAYIVNQRIYYIPFEIHVFIIALLIGIVLYLGSEFLAQQFQVTYIAWGISAMALVLYGVCLVLLGKLTILTAIRTKLAMRQRIL